MADVVRRLPVYLLLDCSGSMAGEPIESVRQGVRALLADLRGDPQALETAYLSVITFANTAQQVCPLTELMSFQDPNLSAGGGTSMGAGLKLLEDCLENEVHKPTPTQKGDWKPLVFLMTDGQPTDTWEPQADRLKSRKLGNVIACAAGCGANSTLLKRITEIVVEINNLQPDTLKAFFRWVSSSIKTTSQSVAQGGGAAPAMPPPPPQIQIVP
jgi:uncharacterized protein YegL